jgi:hypothetical protein
MGNVLGITGGKDIKNSYFTSKKIFFLSGSIHAFRNESGPFFFYPNWFAHSLKLHMMT